jgi:hypothetical protein
MMILQNVLFCYEEYGHQVVFEDLLIICCRHVTLLESTVYYNNCIIVVILLFTLRHNVTCFFIRHGCNN